MSIRLHPERCILLTGLPGANVLDTSMEVARRLRRRYLDASADLAKRNSSAVARFFQTTRSANGNDSLSLMVREYCFRNRSVIALNLKDPLPPAEYSNLRACCFTVMLDPPLTTFSSSNSETTPDYNGWHKQLLDCDILVGPKRLTPAAAARLIVHCFFT